MKILSFRNTIKAAAAFLLITVLSAGFTSCNDVDVVSSSVEEVIDNQKLAGSWYAKAEIRGTNEHNSYYSSIIKSVHFNEDGTGYWMEVVLDKSGLYVKGQGGQEYGTFHYVIAQDQTINITMDENHTDVMDYDLRYKKGLLINADNQIAGSMLRANTTMEQTLQDFDAIITAHISCGL